MSKPIKCPSCKKCFFPHDKQVHCPFCGHYILLVSDDIFDWFKNITDKED